MQFRPMDPDKIRQVLEDQFDALTPRVGLTLGSCRCGGVMVPKVDPDTGISVRKCVNCGCTESLDSGLVTSLGNPEKTREVEFHMVNPPSSRTAGR